MSEQAKGTDPSNSQEKSMNIKDISIEIIRPYEKNPRKNKKAVKVVKDSLSQYGFQQPIVVDKDLVIIVGHTRYQAAKELKYTKVPVIVADSLTEQQVKAYRLMDNRSNEYAVWDDELLMQELSDLIQDENIQDLSFETGKQAIRSDGVLFDEIPDTTKDEIVDANITELFNL